MRNGARAARAVRAVRVVVGGGALVVGLSACGLLGGGDGNSAKVCEDTKQAYQQYVTRVRSVSADDPAQWKQATEQLAGRIDGLAKQAEKQNLKQALTDEAKRLRTAAASVGTGDAAQLNSAMSGTPDRIGKACS